jgi:hypothetical protein
LSHRIRINRILGTTERNEMKSIGSQNYPPDFGEGVIEGVGVDVGAGVAVVFGVEVEVGG